MKSVTLKFVTLAVAMLMMVLSGRKAHAQSVLSGPPGDVCKATNNLDGYLSVPIDRDTCVLMVNTAEHDNGAQAVATCKYLQAQGALGDMNLGECVRNFKSAHDFGGSNLSWEVFAALLLGWTGWRTLRRMRFPLKQSAPC